MKVSRRIAAWKSATYPVVAVTVVGDDESKSTGWLKISLKPRTTEIMALKTILPFSNVSPTAI